MVSLKALKTRTHSVKSIGKVTHVMKLISVSKLKKARDTFESSQAYINLIGEILGSMAKDIESEDRQTVNETLPLLLGRELADKHLILAVGSERGLCGSFNNNLAKEIRSAAKNMIQQGKAVSILCVGDKAYKALKDSPGAVVKLLDERLESMAKVEKFIQNLSEQFRDGIFDTCEIFYTTFISPVLQAVTSKALIPLNRSLEAATVSESNELKQQSFECSPNRIHMLRELATQFLSDLVFAILLEASASEHAARMTAMENASTNAKDIIETLTSVYNKKRQSNVTTELTEIISGAEAIKATN